MRVHVGLRTLGRHLHRRVAVIAAGDGHQVLAARELFAGTRGRLGGARERRGDHQGNSQQTFSGNSRLSPLASLIYWLGKLSIHRASSAMASVSTAVVPSGGICCSGSRERMRSATTLDAG